MGSIEEEKMHSKTKRQHILYIYNRRRISGYRSLDLYNIDTTIAIVTTTTATELRL